MIEKNNYIANCLLLLKWNHGPTICWQVTDNKHKRYTYDHNHMISFHFEISLKHENQWDADEDIIIMRHGEDYGIHHIFPAGYSSMTYDPETTTTMYPGYDVHEFVRLGMTQDQRDHLYNILKQGDKRET